MRRLGGRTHVVVIARPPSRVWIMRAAVHGGGVGAGPMSWSSRDLQAGSVSCVPPSMRRLGGRTHVVVVARPPSGVGITRSAVHAAAWRQDPCRGHRATSKRGRDHACHRPRGGSAAGPMPLVDAGADRSATLSTTGGRSGLSEPIRQIGPVARPAAVNRVLVAPLVAPRHTAQRLFITSGVANGRATCNVFGRPSTGGEVRTDARPLLLDPQPSACRSLRQPASSA